MKNRWLIGLATAAMAVTMAFGFVACGGDENEPDPGPGPGPGIEGETLTDSEIAKRAINTVKGLYGSTEVQTTGADYQVLGQTKVGGKTYTYDWSVSSTFEGYENYVTVGELVGNYVTIGIKKATVEIEYTLKASVTVGEVTESIEFLKKIPKGEERTEETVTKSLAFSMDTRTSTEAAKQVYAQNGVTVTNLKGSGSDISSSYYGRFYKGSVVQIEFPGILHIDFHTHPGYDDANYSEELQKSLLAAYPDAKIGVTDGETEDLVSFELGSATDIVEFTCTAQIRMNSIDVEGKAGGASAADKVKSAKSTLKLSQQNYFELDTIALPTEENGVSVSWALSGSSDYVKVSENKLNVTSLPDSGSAQATLTATLKLEEEQDTKDVTITLLPAPTLTNVGTAAHPYTAVEALTVTNLVDDNGYYSKSGAPRAVYVTGYVVNIGSWNSDFSNWNNVYIADSATSTKDSEDAIQIFRMVPNDVLAEGNLQLGAKITVVGFLQNYKGNTPEITFNGDTSVTASSYNPPTDDQQIKNALAAVPETLTVSSTGVTPLPASTVAAVTFSWALKDGNSLPEGSSYAEGKITVTTLPAEEKQVVFTVTATCGSEPAQTKDVTVTFTPESSATEGFTPISSPAAGSDYYLAMDINGTWYYSTGAMAGHFLGTTTDISAAAKVTVASSDNGWTLQTNGKYIEIQKVDGYNNIVLADAQTAGQVWVWDESHAVFTMTVGTDTFFMGTYGDYTTFNAAFVSYLDKDNEYIGKIGTYSGSVTPEPGPGGETTGDFTAITAPQAGSNYYMSMKIADGKEHYLTGSLDGQGYYLTTTTELSQAAKVELRADGAGWLILVGGKYLELKLSSDKTHANPVLLSAQTSNMHWEWDETNKIFTWTDENNTKWFLGTRSDRTFDTVGGCDYNKYVAENYKAVVGTVGGEGGGTQPQPETAQQKAQRALSELEIPSTLEADFTMPESPVEGVELKFTAVNNSAIQIAEGGVKLTVTRSTTDVEGTVTVSATIDGVTETQEYAVKVLRQGSDPAPEKGTEENPYTPSDAIAVAKALESGGYTETPVYVTGYVAKIESGPSVSNQNWYKVTIVDAKDNSATGADALLIFKIYPKEGTGLELWGDLSVGSKITLKGYLMNYNGNTPEMSDKDGTKIETVEYVDARTAEEKANAAIKTAKEAIDGKIIGVTETTFALPASDVTGVTLSYAGTGVVGTTLTVTHGAEETTVEITISAANATLTGEAVKATITIAKQVASDETVLDFVSHFETYASDWKNSYVSHELTFTQLGESTVNGTVKFSNVSKQTGTLTDRPVIAANAAEDKNYPTVYVTVELTDKTISSISFNLKGWSSNKKFSNIHIEYTTDGDVWTKCSDDVAGTISTDGQAIVSTSIPEGVKTVRLVITTTAASNQQVGLTSIIIKTADAPAAAPAPMSAQIALLPGKEF